MDLGGGPDQSIILYTFMEGYLSNPLPLQVFVLGTGNRLALAYLSWYQL